MTRDQKKINFLLSAFLLEGMLGIGLVLFSRYSSVNIFSDGSRTALVFLLLSLLIAVGALVLFVFFRSRKGMLPRLIRVLHRDRWFFIILLLLVLVFGEILQDLIFISSAVKAPYYQTYIDRIITYQPVLLGIALLIFQAAAVLVWVRLDVFRRFVQNRKNLGWVIPFAVLLLCVALILIADWGFITRPTRPGIMSLYGKFVPTRAPLPGIHVFVIVVVLLIGFTTFQALTSRWELLGESKLTQIFIFVLIWGAAFVLWKGVPLKPNIMVDIVNGPAGTVFPSSDAFYYDKESIRFLLGKGFSEESTHVMYSAFLAALHKLFGLDYLPVVTAQMAVFALIPVFLYLITSNLLSTFSGLLAAFLFIIRERNMLLLGGNVTGIGFNIMMSENLALLTWVALFYLVFLWVKNPQSRGLLPWIAGGLMGISILTRVEMLAVSLAVGLGALLALWDKRKIWLRGAVTFSLAVILVVGPWMIRNWQKAGRLSIDKGDFVHRMVSQYIGTDLDNQVLDKSENESFQTETYAEKSFHGTSLANVPDHLSNSLLQTVLYLPTNHQPFFTTGSILERGKEGSIRFSRQGIFSEKYLLRYTRNLPYFWYVWDGSLSIRSYLPLLMVLFLCSLGIWVVWKKQHIVITILFLAFTAHLMIWALAGYSGGRFIKLVDWIPLVFYSIGLTVLLSILWRVIVKGKVVTDLSLQFTDGLFCSQGVNYKQNRWFESGVLAVVLLLGTAPTILEPLIPQQFTEEKKAQVMESIRGDINLDKGQYVYLYGKMLYPRFHEANEKPLDDRKGTIPDPTRDRRDFYLIGTRTIWVSFPTKQSVESFRHDVDVIVEGRIVRDTNFDLMYGGKQPYFLASRILILK